MISAKVPYSNHPGEATLPLRWFCQLPLCRLAAQERLQVQSFLGNKLIFHRAGGLIEMPVPHLEIRIIQRSKGSSAVAGAAYQAGEKLFSEYDQKSKDHRRKQ